MRFSSLLPVGLRPAYATLRTSLASVREWSTEARRVAFYRQFVAPDDLVFDIGANVGNRVSAFCRLGARTVAFEPQQSCVERLRRRFGSDRRVRIVQKAVGPGTEGHLRPGEASTISSMSEEWINATKASGRFSHYEWGAPLIVPMIGFDAAIDLYGEPVFAKIDVEGFEAEVLRTLSRPIRALSIEVTPERVTDALASMDLLAKLGEYEFNISLGETMQMALQNWIPDAEMRANLHKLPQREVGDIYARYVRN